MIKADETNGAPAAKCKKTYGVRNPNYPYRSEYKAWKKAKERCKRTGDKSYAAYGGVGVKMCSGWDLSFQQFLDDMGGKPTNEHSIDRIDVEGHYSCGKCHECKTNGWVMNCRWSNRRTQNRNMKQSRKITAFGRTQILIDWAEETGLSSDSISHRIKKGWSPEMALSQPLSSGSQPKDILSTSSDLVPLKNPFPKTGQIMDRLEECRAALMKAWGVLFPGDTRHWVSTYAETPKTGEERMLMDIESMARILKERWTKPV